MLIARIAPILAAAAVALAVTAADASAQRISLAELDQQLMALEAQLAGMETTALVEQDYAGGGLNVLVAGESPIDEAASYILLVGRRFGEATGACRSWVVRRTSSGRARWSSRPAATRRSSPTRSRPRAAAIRSCRSTGSTSRSASPARQARRGRQGRKDPSGRRARQGRSGRLDINETQCGDDGSESDLRILYSGPDQDHESAWLCLVHNQSANKNRRVRATAFCGLPSPTN